MLRRGRGPSPECARPRIPLPKGLPQPRRLPARFRGPARLGPCRQIPGAPLRPGRSARLAQTKSGAAPSSGSGRGAGPLGRQPARPGSGAGRTLGYLGNPPHGGCTHTSTCWPRPLLPTANPPTHTCLFSTRWPHHIRTSHNTLIVRTNTAYYAACKSMSSLSPLEAFKKLTSEGGSGGLVITFLDLRGNGGMVCSQEPTD